MFTLYSADFINAPSNCSYPHKFEVTDSANFADAVSRDYVCAEYMNNYRNGDNFLGSDCLPVDCDNDHSENLPIGSLRLMSRLLFPALPLPFTTVAFICVRRTANPPVPSSMCCFLLST